MVTQLKPIVHQAVCVVQCKLSALTFRYSDKAMELAFWPRILLAFVCLPAKAEVVYMPQVASVRSSWFPVGPPTLPYQSIRLTLK
jgi:hypothetical protein